MTEVYVKINRVPRLYGIRWILFLMLLAVLFFSMFALIKLTGAAGIVLSFVVTGLVYGVLLLLEQTDRFKILGLVDHSIELELTSMGQTGQQPCISASDPGEKPC